MAVCLRILFFVYFQAKRVYDNKSKEQEQIDVNVNTVKNAGVSNMPTKEWEKVSISFLSCVSILKVFQYISMFVSPKQQFRKYFKLVH